ncbi:Copper amine oxidase N-terminal domain-containing protein [Acetoanaerobium noterae]|uniref:Copper amine oxidase N-terminal domain-containing protein n=1 Tax=Acetoanaerobium noterae TaxID=745369 RepID=A0A1T5BH75_9FIRM|nr:stalk domain-containing protein [Acetoanaerobium noterae]SKB46369.1 Copper amine oxidase N-terminal domain-containing protein [Acetoanaerobium noterae]
MKKMIKVFTVGSLVLGMTSNIAMADSVLTSNSAEQVNAKAGVIQDDSLKEEKISYMSFEGYVKEIKSNNGYTSVIMTDGKSDEVIGQFNLKGDMLVVNQDTATIQALDKIEKGQKIRGFYRKDMPMILIYPPVINPEFIMISSDDTKNFVKHSYFDENLTSIDNNLKLNISDSSVLIDKHGKSVDIEKLKNKDLVVVYDVSTKSIPAQTNPKQVIMLEKDADEMPVKDEALEKIIDSGYMANGVNMIPLKQVADHFGYEIAWDNSTKTATLRKENSSFTVTIGQQMYGYNKSLQKFEVSPEVKDARTYVPESILELLQQ